MSDGSKLRLSWTTALNAAEARFRQLMTSSSTEWKRVTNNSDGLPSKRGKARAPTIPELTDVAIHRNVNKSGEEAFRLVLDVPTGDEIVSLEPWKAVLTTPELRQEWDPAVEEAHLLELFDHSTRICKTNFTLGWPANPRDAVTISRSFQDPTTIIDITTSLPRSQDEPAYLRPSPPYVRSNVTLFAWCIQHIQPQVASNVPVEQTKKKSTLSGKIRLTCFWQHDLKALWGLGSSSGLQQQLSTMTLGLLKTVLKRGSHVPKLTGYGNGVSIERVRFQVDREALTIDYVIIPEEDEHSTHTGRAQGMDEVHALREQRRLTRSIECVLPSSEGWDVRVTTKASSEEVEQLPWSASAIRSNALSSQSSGSPEQIILRLSHAALIDDHSVLKVRVVIEISGPSSGLRLNGLPQTIQDIEDRDPSSYFISEQIFQDVSSAVDLSFNTTSSLGTLNSTASTSSPVESHVHPIAERTAAADKSILSRVRRNYIYFSSLLQEPEAKWRRTTEARGVSITQLDSIDPTLVVYRAEATFVGVGLWDLYGAVMSPGAKIYWDKQHEDAVLLEDVNELTELWHYKTRPAWPVNGRDAVVLKTVYKSPTTIHVFSFSVEDPHLFPNIPPVEPNVIRTQVDLQGWAIESLSPTTTLLTLLEQSDPKGWTNKTSIPTQMINSLAGIGEFAIKCGGPPVLIRLTGAKANELRYDHERSSFRVEYEARSSRRIAKGVGQDENEAISSPIIECEIRCDIDTWAPSLDIVVDPPPQTISCLRRHRLSVEGGGLWLLMTHDAMFVDDDRLLAIVRRAPGKEKGLVMVNGAKITIDVEELPDHEIKMLTKQKRVKPPRIPLDQPPVIGVIRQRKAEWDADSKGTSDSSTNTAGTGISAWASAPRISSPLARFFSYAMEQATTTTQQAVAAISPATASGSTTMPLSSKLPMQYALEALAWAQETHSFFPSTGWEPASDKGLPVYRKLAPEICPAIPVHKGSKVIEGVSAEELAAVVTESDCRKQWDDRYDSVHVLESFGGEARTAFIVSKTGFPWRDRGFYVASVMARACVPPAVYRRNISGGEVAEHSNGIRNAIFCVSASFNPDSVALFAPVKYNSYALPIGRVYVDAWILETLDPYTKENYAIPSTRCTRLVAMDYAGAIPAAVNSMINATLPKSILAVETYIKGRSPHPLTRLPVPGLVITDKKPDEHLATVAWKLKKRDENRVLVSTKYSSEDRVYNATILVAAPPSLPSSPPPSRIIENGGIDPTTPRPSRLMLSPNSARFAEPSLGADSSTSSSSIQSDTSVISDLPTTPSTPPLPSSPSSPLPASHRQRTADLSSVSTSSIRGRASSSAFTVKGEVRPSTDLIVAELVVDSKLYPGGYNVLLRSKMRVDWRIGQGSRSECIPLRSLSSGSDTALSDSILPLAYTIHTMPSSPLHSSGLNEGGSPTRHLLRLSLPTAQYQISTVRDPLTGEVQSAPPIPAWLTEMQEGGVIIGVEIRPRKDKTYHNGREELIIRVDGSEVAVVGEKESLTSVGREELLDDRVSKMGVLSRIPSETEPLPEELKVPVAIADDLLDTAVTNSASPDTSKQIVEDGTLAEQGKESPSTQPADQQKLLLPTPSDPHVPHVVSGGLLGFLHAYNNPLARFTTGGMTATTEAKSSTNTSNTATILSGVITAASPSPPAKELPGGLGDIDATAMTSNIGRTRRQYPMSTVLAVALIAFLIGSLLRSLLSPADFVYVVTDLKDVEEVNNIGGWREMHRLVEMKYIIGGWDLQVAVVRRH